MGNSQLLSGVPLMPRVVKSSSAPTLVDSGTYGTEVIIDLHGCNKHMFKRAMLTGYFDNICPLLGLKQERLYFWGYDTEREKAAAPPHLSGTSAIQFISTSNITLHALDKLGAAYINIFACGEFDIEAAIEFSENFFQASSCAFVTMKRL